jgi:hypothetical protein
MAIRRRVGGILLVIGYLGVVVGSIAWVIAYYAGGLNHAGTVYQATLGLGLVMAGAAGWRWTVVGLRHEIPGIRTPGRWMAASTLILAAAPAALTYNAFDLHRQMSKFTHSVPAYPHYRTIIAGGTAFTLGLLVASSGFVVLSTATRIAQENSNVPSPEGAMQGHATTKEGSAQ